MASLRSSLPSWFRSPAIWRPAGGPAPSAAPGEPSFAALDRQRDSAAWQRDGGAYIPFPASWLNGRRWEDEDPDAGRNGHGDPRRVNAAWTGVESGEVRL